MNYKFQHNNFYFYFYIFMLFIIFLNLLGSDVYAKECGYGIACECGDSLVESKELSLLDDIGYCYGSALKIEKDNIELSCFGKKIENMDINKYASGLIVKGNNVSISNCIIKGFYNGIEIIDSNQGKIYNNTLVFNQANGISMNNSNSFEIYENIISNNSWDGIFLLDSSFNIIENNDINYNYIDGIQIFHDSVENQIFSNNLSYNDGHAIAPVNCENNILDEFNIGGNGKPIKYIANVENVKIYDSSEFSEIILCGVSNGELNRISIENNHINSDGILLVNSEKITVKNSFFSNTRAGVYFYNTKNSKIIGNSFTNNDYALRFVRGSENNLIENNYFLNTNEYIIKSEDSYFNSYENNYFDSLKLDIDSWNDFQIIYLNGKFVLEGSAQLLDRDNLKEGNTEIFFGNFILLLLLLLLFPIILTGVFLLVRRYKKNT
jgi:parallel beta-helix repeat protein